MAIIKNMSGERIKVISNKKSITIFYRNKKVNIKDSVSDRLEYLLNHFKPNIYKILDIEILEVAYFNDLDIKENLIINKIKQKLPREVSVSISTKSGCGIKLTFFYKKNDGVKILSLLANPDINNNDLENIINIIKKDLCL